MIESVLPSGEERVVAKDSMAPMTAGGMLRNAREASGLQMAAMAGSLKVPVNKLEALEADRFDLLPDAVFVRALAASVCRTLKIDPIPVLEKLPHTSARQLKVDQSGINIPFHSSGGSSRLLSWDQFSKPFAWLVMAMLVGALALVLFPLAERFELATSPKSAPDAVMVPLPAPVPAAVEIENPAPAATTVPAASSPVAPASASDVTVAGSGASTGIVVFKARGASWVQVIDARGVVQLRQTMTDGAVVGASGEMPLSVVVGSVDVTEVQVRGQVFDLTRIAKDNIARFEVK
jgi:cytoskeleton protein RodZ